MDSGGVGGNETSATLLGDVVEIRAALNKVKETVLKGPMVLKMSCVVVCIVAIAFDFFSVLADVVALKPFQLVITMYAGTFAFLAALLEFQHMYFGPLKGWINIWLKMLTRIWGRGIFYILAGGIHLSIGGLIGYLCGALLVCCGVACLILSRIATRELNELHDRIVKEHTDDLVYIRQTFNRYDKDNNGTLSIPELAACAKELGTEFTPPELVAIFEYLDQDFSGSISYDEFERWWTGASEINYDRIPLA